MLLGAFRSSTKVITNLALTSIIVYSMITEKYLFQFGLPDGETQLLPACFALGALFANNKEIIEISGANAIWAVLLSYFFWKTAFHQYIFYAAFFYCVTYISKNRLIKAIKLPGDYSYGIYIYGWLVQQSLVSVWPQMGLHTNQFIALLLANLLAVVSWNLVEKNGISLGSTIFKKFNSKH